MASKALMAAFVLIAMVALVVITMEIEARNIAVWKGGADNKWDNVGKEIVDINESRGEVRKLLESQTAKVEGLKNSLAKEYMQSFKMRKIHMKNSLAKEYMQSFKMRKMTRVFDCFGIDCSPNTNGDSFCQWLSDDCTECSKNKGEGAKNICQSKWFYTAEQQDEFYSRVVTLAEGYYKCYLKPCSPDDDGDALCKAIPQDEKNECVDCTRDLKTNVCNNQFIRRDLKLQIDMANEYLKNQENNPEISADENISGLAENEDNDQEITEEIINSLPEEITAENTLVEGTDGGLVEGTGGELVEGTDGGLVQGTGGGLVQGNLPIDTDESTKNCCLLG